MKTSRSKLIVGTKRKNKKNPSGGASIFSFAARNRFKNFEEGARRLTKAFSFRDIHNSDEEPGLYCKFPRITIMAKKVDALSSFSADQLLEFIKDRENSETKQYTWVDIQGTHDQMPEIGKAFGLHPLTTEDCVVLDTREKITVTTEYILLIVHDVSLPGDKGVNLNMIIFPDLLLTIHEKPLHSIYDIVPKLEYCDDTEIPSIEFVVYVILSSVISFYGARLEQVKLNTEVLEDEVLATSKVDKKEMSNLLAKLSVALKRCSATKEEISIKKDLLGSLSRNDTLFSPKGLLYIKSAYDQVLKMDLQISFHSEMLEDLNELYMGKISAQLAVVANDVGIITRQFAVISATFLPASLISGILGMNMLIPSEADSEHPNRIPFTIVMIVILAISFGQLFFYRKMKWV